MADAWFTQVPDEVARCVADAQSCAEACERLLEDTRTLEDAALREQLVSALVAPAAVARVLGELVEHPASLALAACRLCHETAGSALEVLEQIDGRVDDRAAVTALRAFAESCQRLIDAAGS
jgi:hypothetical protein